TSFLDRSGLGESWPDRPKHLIHQFTACDKNSGVDCARKKKSIHGIEVAVEGLILRVPFEVKRNLVFHVIDLVAVEIFLAPDHARSRSHDRLAVFGLSLCLAP